MIVLVKSSVARVVLVRGVNVGGMTGDQLANLPRDLRDSASYSGQRKCSNLDGFLSCALLGWIWIREGVCGGTI